MVRYLIVELSNLVKYCNRKYFVKILGVPIWSSFLRRPNDRRCFGIMKYLFIMSRKKNFDFQLSYIPGTMEALSAESLTRSKANYFVIRSTYVVRILIITR